MCKSHKEKRRRHTPVQGGVSPAEDGASSPAGQGQSPCRVWDRVPFGAADRGTVQKKYRTKNHRNSRTHSRTQNAVPKKLSPDTNRKRAKSAQKTSDFSVPRRSN